MISQQGKLAQTSEDFRKIFLLKFTAELIKNTKIEEFYKLKKIVEREPEKDIELESDVGISEKSDVKKVGLEKEYMPSLMYHPRFARPRFKPLPKQPLVVPKLPIVPPKIKAPQMQKPIPQQSMPRRRPNLMPIPNYPLPPGLQYLQPYPTQAQVNLGKLNPLIQDPAVRNIECNGPGEPVIVKGAMGMKPTKIILSDNDIKSTIQAFSEAAKIPVDEGVYKIIAGNLILSAIVSEVISSKFIINKMTSQSMVPSGIKPMYG